MIIRVLVVDDEPLARVGIISRLSACSDMQVVAECSTGEEARALITQMSPDLIFIDVEMPGISGLDLLKELPREQARCIVFLTAHEEYALDAFNVEALDYLLKPIDDTRFEACIERARRMFALHRQEANFERLYGLLASPDKEDTRHTIKRFPVRRGNEFTFVQAGDVDWIEGLGDYAGLHVGGRTHLIREPLASLEARLDAAQFVRIHRSTIVQVERIARVDPSANRDAVLTLRDGTSLRVSRTYRSHLDELLRRS
ncbi:MAG TPA: LytTR family DNA-binding domain-containing protein [Terracidiphilus sp.]|nr:LytTR family DNA-binding domain-containing protein [Terracidiphilus sp.]